MMPKITSRTKLAPVLIVVMSVLGAASLSARCASVGAASLYFGESIGVLFDRSIDSAVVRQAIDLWGGCSNYSSGFPSLLAGSRGTRNVRVSLRPGKLGRGRCGSFSGSQIELYERMVDRRGRIHACGSIELNLAHELGHVLGLDDAPVEARCERHVMAWITPGNAFDRLVQRDECLAVGQTWLTAQEWDHYSEGGSPDEVRNFTQGRQW